MFSSGGLRSSRIDAAAWFPPYSQRLSLNELNRVEERAGRGPPREGEAHRMAREIAKGV